MPNRPGILDEQGVVVVGSRSISTGSCLQDGCEILDFRVAVLSGTLSLWGAVNVGDPFARQSAAIASAEGKCLRSVRLPVADKHIYKGQVAVLIDYVGQPVELIASLDVVGTCPTAFEEGNVLVELIVLAGIDLSKTLIEGSSGRAARHLQSAGGWNRRAPVRTSCTRGDVLVVASAQATGYVVKVHALGRPSKIVIVSKEVTVTRGGDDLRGQGYVSADVVSGIRS